MRRRWAFFALIGVGAGAGLAAWMYAAPEVPWDAPPEGSTGWRTELDRVAGAQALVVAAHPRAAEAGRRMLSAGGRAIDAAIAVQAMLTLVEPQSSGIGGGAFLLHWDARRQKLVAWDGRETAPAKVQADAFVGAKGRPKSYLTALLHGNAVGTPGVLAMLHRAHQASGRLPWRDLFQPAIQAARDGFEVTPRLARLVRADLALALMPTTRAYFFPEGEALAVGQRRKNPALAATLTALAEDGPEVFYEGRIATDIAAAVSDARSVAPASRRWAAKFRAMGLGLPSFLIEEVPAPGPLERSDLAQYAPQVRTPVCLPVFQRRVCGFPPPTSGGITVLQILAMLAARDDPAWRGPLDPAAAHFFVEALRLAFADRGRFIADPDFVEVPAARLLDRGYLKQRADLIAPNERLKKPRPGLSDLAQRWAGDASPELPSTSHVSIVDADGNAVSMTTSIEYAFGAHIMVGGFLLNNQLTDFSFLPERKGRPVANAIAPGKRPRSSMAPFIVLDAKGRVEAVVGSPGGSRIIAYVAQTLWAMLRFGHRPQAAVSLPHIAHSPRLGVELEADGAPWPAEWKTALVAGLRQRGHRVRFRALNSGLHAIARRGAGQGWESGIDPRREGHAEGL